MLETGIAPLVLAGVLAYSMTVTLATNWLAAGARRPEFPPRLSLRLLADSLANLIWFFLIVVYGVIAVRYTERMSHVAIGYLLFAVAGSALSLGRAYLFRRVQQRRKPEHAIDRQAIASMLLHNAGYLLWALVLYIVLCWVVGLPVSPTLLIPLWIGALLPDLDERESLPGRLLPCLSERLERHLDHLEKWHTLAAAAMVALVSSPLIPLFGAQAWYLIPLGFGSHLLLDLLTPRGVMLLWPINRVRYTVLRGAIESQGGHAERVLLAVLALVAAVLFFAAGPSITTQPAAPTLSYQQMLERYYSLRGRIQVFAQITGSWQVSGRPISGRFEILNANDASYVLLDRFGDKIFTAGRASEDNVYLDRITLQSGPAVTVKPVEIHLTQQPLSDALDTIYEMQSEPGLQHIYVSGDLLLADQQGNGSPVLQPDYSLTSLRKIQAQEGELYSLHYLSAAELIQISGLQVDAADLVIVATYTTPASGPTATPLPSVSSAAAHGQQVQ